MNFESIFVTRCITLFTFTLQVHKFSLAPLLKSHVISPLPHIYSFFDKIHYFLDFSQCIIYSEVISEFYPLEMLVNVHNIHYFCEPNKAYLMPSTLSGYYTVIWVLASYCPKVRESFSGQQILAWTHG